MKRQQPKARRDLMAVLYGNRTEATIPVNDHTKPLLEAFIADVALHANRRAYRPKYEHGELWEEDALGEKLDQCIARVKSMTLRKGDRLGKTKRYYQTFGGGCRQMFTVNGRVDEYPYSLKKAIPCRLPGPHPHPSVIQPTRKNLRKRNKR